MIKYPTLKENYTIGMTAPSSGVNSDLHYLIDEVKEKFSKNHRLIIGDTVYTQEKAKSAEASVRAKELNDFLKSDDVDIIIPPWGGELAIEILELIDYDSIPSKWILGYSDTSAVLLAITLKTGIATAHGTNLVDLRDQYSDETTAKWESVLKTRNRVSITQQSSKTYQSQWEFSTPTDYIFNFNKKTEWKSATLNQNVKFEGRILGGCIDIIRHFVGTPYGDIKKFRKNFLDDEPIIYYFENCELSPTDFKRSLMQLKYAGWFEHCNGILFGRTKVNYDVEGYTIEDVYDDIANDLQIPIIYDIDCGHQPPQITFVNGAYGIVQYDHGKGIVTQKFI